MKNYVNKENLTRSLMLRPAKGYEVARLLGAGMEANRVYEAVSYNPEKLLQKQSKKAVVVRSASRLVGVLSSLEKEVGIQILNDYYRSEDEKIEVMYDVDDILNELYLSEEEV